MSANAQLRLVNHTSTQQEDSFRFDRRRAIRHDVSARVTAVRRGRQAGAPAGICSLQLLDLSDTGAGAVAQENIEAGSMVTLLFPPHGPERGFDRVGQVVRCEHRDTGTHIGIRFEAQAMVA